RAHGAARRQAHWPARRGWQAAAPEEVGGERIMAARASPIAKEGHIRLPFRDRYEAGRVPASRLLAFEGRSDLLILALPRGGLPVAYEVARALEAPLDVFMVRKLGAPQQPELAMGAIATGGTLVLNSEVVQALRITREEIEAEVRAEEEE